MFQREANFSLTSLYLFPLYHEVGRGLGGYRSIFKGVLSSACYYAEGYPYDTPNPS